MVPEISELVGEGVFLYDALDINDMVARIKLAIQRKTAIDWESVLERIRKELDYKTMASKVVSALNTRN